MAFHCTTIFAGVVTENTSTNRNAWEQLSRKHPSTYFKCCPSHGLDLFVKDVFGAIKTKKGKNEQQPTYPIDYPVEDLLEFVASCKDIVKLFTTIKL